MAINKAELFVANTSNVKEMKNGRPQNVRIAEAGKPNCTIVTLGATLEAELPELDHVHATTVVELAAAKAGDFVVVAPEIMVEEARKTDGHIGKYRLEQGGVHTAYELQLHDRLELSEAYFESVPAVGQEIGNFKVISVRDMALGAIIAPEGGLYDAASMKMIKIELVK